MYPLLLEPKLVPLIWGGDTLVRRYGKAGDPQAAIGESWECWDENRIGNGAHAGKTIAALRRECGAALMGSLDSSRIFPILTKFIDARQSLSVQVHPDDAYAQRTEKQPNGKTECWYILEARPDATLVLGFNRDTSRDEYLARVRDGTLGEVLRHIPVRGGDVLYLPAGTLHAIGAGIVLFEVQQASDLTYRIFDWNRVGVDGKPRALHVEKAAEVLSYRQSHRGALRPCVTGADASARVILVADTHFFVERRVCDEQARSLPLHGAPVVVSALDACLEVEANGISVRVPPYATALLPAALERITVRAVSGGGGYLSVTPYAPGMREILDSLDPGFTAQFQGMC
jgi:mannose-6-phosphate isomerase